MSNDSNNKVYKWERDDSSKIMLYLEGMKESEYLYNKGEIDRVFDQIPDRGEQKQVYLRYKDNPDFKELQSTKYYNGLDGLKSLVFNVSVLEDQKNDAIQSCSNPNFYYSPIIPNVNDAPELAKAQISDCLKNLNKFLKSNCSDDLKDYIVATKSHNLKFYVNNLSKIDQVPQTKEGILGMLLYMPFPVL